jgi:hypothetical protein
MSSNFILSKIEKIIGSTYGKWLAISHNLEHGNGTSKGKYILCRCECGTEKLIRFDSLLKGSKSCGCSKGIQCGVKYPCIRVSEHPLYQVWTDMNRRCYSKGRKDYKHYGGRGGANKHFFIS